MSLKYLGDTLDIHAGGEDLIFPHHENEIAQSEGATGKPFVRFWLHCRFLLVNGEKMSKSKGNYYTLRDLCEKGADPSAIRFLLISHHYRTPLNFTLEGLEQAALSVRRLDDFFYRIKSCQQKKTRKGNGRVERKTREWLQAMESSLDDDLHIGEALASLFRWVTEINAILDQGLLSQRELHGVIAALKKFDSIVGLSIVDPVDPGRVIREMIRERERARARRDFARSDQLRREIYERGWLLMDGRPGEPSIVKRRKRVWDTLG